MSKKTAKTYIRQVRRSFVTCVKAKHRTARSSARLLLSIALGIAICSAFVAPLQAQGSLPLGTIISLPGAAPCGAGWFSYVNGQTLIR